MKTDLTEYKERLDRFNSTPKYLSELDLLLRLVNPLRGETILDYGCGTGTAVQFIRERSAAKVLGFDRYEYTEPTPEWFRAHVYFHVNKAYFMHSLAHIEFPVDILRRLREYLQPKATISVITPNLLWIINTNPKDYKPDPTVIQHFTASSLKELFEKAGYKIKHIGETGEILLGHHERLFLLAEI